MVLVLGVLGMNEGVVLNGFEFKTFSLGEFFYGSAFSSKALGVSAFQIFWRNIINEFD